mmetsp:Transcript_70591/g.177962  ORF Transcript_70591/g.177962 Transcript_70591/m.177962 type:complete len:205 (-) Transcript_70591:1213-1827(-)
MGSENEGRDENPLPLGSPPLPLQALRGNSHLILNFSAGICRGCRAAAAATAAAAASGGGASESWDSDVGGTGSLREVFPADPHERCRQHLVALQALQLLRLQQLRPALAGNRSGHGPTGRDQDPPEARHDAVLAEVCLWSIPFGLCHAGEQGLGGRGEKFLGVRAGEQLWRLDCCDAGRPHLSADRRPHLAQVVLPKWYQCGGS